MFILLYREELEVSQPGKSMFIFRKPGQPETCWETQKIIYVLDFRLLPAMNSITLPNIQCVFYQYI